MMDDPRDMIDVSDQTPADDASEAKKEAPHRPVAPQQGGGFLESFLAQQDDTETESGAETAEAAAPTEPAKTPEELQERVIDVLREIYDPEIPVNIYDLGLIYGVDVDDSMIVTVTMTLTSPHCPVAEIMPGEVEVKSNAVPGASAAEVKLVWEPAWSLDMMTDEAKLELGML